MISSDTDNATSSRESEDGVSLLASLAGVTTTHSGPAPAPASRSRSRAKAKEPMMQGTYGRTYIASPVPDGPLSLWESKLRERLAKIGSTESALIWAKPNIKQGRSISRLSPSTRHINGPESTGSLWPTPQARQKGGGDYSNPIKALARLKSGHQVNLGDMMTAFAPWATPTCRDHKDSAGMVTIRPDGRTRIDRTAMQMIANWSTPRASDGAKGGPNMAFGAGGQPLPAQIAQTAKQLATFGTKPTTSTVTTAKSAGSPTPMHPCWLMGFPTGFLLGAVLVTRSTRGSRKKS